MNQHSNPSYCVQVLQGKVKQLSELLAALTLRVEALEERELGEFDDLVEKPDVGQPV